MTALAVRLARSLVADVQRALWWQERQARAQHRAMLAAQAAEREQQLAAAQQRCFPSRFVLEPPGMPNCAWPDPLVHARPTGKAQTNY